jgi:hypothetical protein
MPEDESGQESGVDGLDASSLRFSTNRRAIVWGFGILFLTSGAAIVAGWAVDRVLIPPDLGLVGLIVGAVFWSMGVLSEE